MTNKQLVRHIKAFKQARQGWLDLLVDNPDYTAAAQHIIQCNAKIELLLSFWNFNEEGDMP